MRTETRGAQVIDSRRISLRENDGHPSSVGRLTASQLCFRYGVFAILAFGGCIGDLWSKWYVFEKLKCPGRLNVWKGSIAGLSINFDLATTFNRGALWGIGQNQTWLFAGLSFFAVIVVVYFLWTKQAVASWWLTIAAGLLLAGTMGNLYDRLGWHGWKDDHGPVYAVRDFLDFVFCDGAFNWATFNFADMYLVTGAIMLVVQSFLTSASETSATPPATPKEPLTTS